MSEDPTPTAEVTPEATQLAQPPTDVSYEEVGGSIIDLVIAIVGVVGAFFTVGTGGILYVVSRWVDKVSADKKTKDAAENFLLDLGSERLSGLRDLAKTLDKVGKLLGEVTDGKPNVITPQTPGNNDEKL